MTLSKLPRAQIHQLIDIYKLGSSLGRKRDALAVLHLIQRMSAEDIPEFAVAEAFALYSEREFAAARDVLERAERVHDRNPMIKALLAVILFRQRDALWQAYLNELDGLPADEGALELARSIRKATGEIEASAPSLRTDPANAPMLDFPLDAGRPC